MLMQNIERVISKEEYERLNALSYSDFCKEIDPTIPMEWNMGYGYYGSWLRKDEVNDIYYLVHKIGSSCD